MGTKTSENGNMTNAASGLINYFKGVKSEWGKITWPERQQVVVETVFVVGIVFVFTVFIYVVDILFDFVLSKI